jgi:hypothetical protein
VTSWSLLTTYVDGDAGKNEVERFCFQKVSTKLLTCRNLSAVSEVKVCSLCQVVSILSEAAFLLQEMYRASYMYMQSNALSSKNASCLIVTSIRVRVCISWHICSSAPAAPCRLLTMTSRYVIPTIRQICFTSWYWGRRKVPIKESHDACTCEWHNSKRKWRCANEETVDLDLGFLDSLVEHLHATREDLRSKITLVAANMDSSNIHGRRQLGTRSLLDVTFACVIYSLGWSLVATEDLQLDINELLR